MSHVLRRRLARLALGLFSLPALSAGVLSAQTVTPLARQLSRIDFALSGFKQFNGTVNGTNYLGAPVQQSASNPIGGLVTLRYTKSAFLGGEFNYSFARYNQTFTSPVQFPAGFRSPFVVRARASEYTVGYVVHVPVPLLGVKPFGAVGVGTTGFYPDRFNGQGLPARGRLTTYYGIGVEVPLLTSRFGIRAQFRQLFFKAPDFDQNYLTLDKRTTASEPTIGVYAHF